MGFFQNLTGWHALILLAVVLLLFGAAKLPALARSVGQSMKIFRSEIKDRDVDAGSPDAVAPASAAGTATEGETAVTAASRPLTMPIATVEPSARERVPLAEQSTSS